MLKCIQKSYLYLKKEYYLSEETFKVYDLSEQSNLIIKVLKNIFIVRANLLNKGTILVR